MKIIKKDCAKCKKELEDKFIQSFYYNYFILEDKYYMEDVCGDINEITKKEFNVFFE